MERQPILSEDGLAIELIQQPLSLKDLIPKYFFQFQNETVSEESQKMYSELLEFLNTNEELAFMNVDNFDMDSFAKGYQRALSMVKLWIDSIYLD